MLNHLSFDLLAPGWLKLLEHLKALDYQNPKDPTNTALSRALGVTGKVPMQIFFTSPHLNAFGLYMGTLPKVINNGRKSTRCKIE